MLTTKQKARMLAGLDANQKAGLVAVLGIGGALLGLYVVLTAVSYGTGYARSR
jgi:hypothetical protein